MTPSNLPGLLLTQRDSSKLSTGGQESRGVDKKQSEEVKQAHDKESGKKRDSKKAAPQKGPKVPPGKTSVRKGDGRDGEFN